jgi:hypothetical protein
MAQILEPEWFQRIGRTGDDRTTAITVDNSYNVYVTGFYNSNPLNIYAQDNSSNSTTIVNQGSFDIFIVKYDPSGIPQWTRRIGGSSDELSQSVITDSQNNLYVCGYYYSGPLNIYGSNNSTVAFTLTSAGSFDGFIVKYNSQGTPQWARRLGGTGGDNGYQMKIDTSNNLYVVGYYTSSPLNIYSTNNTTVLFTLTNAAAGVSDIFIVKYNLSGLAQWARRISGAADDRGYSVTIDSLNNLYVVGAYGSTTLGIYSTNNTSLLFTLSSQGSNDTFFVKYDPTGLAQWARRLGGTGSDNGYSVVADNSNNLYVAGYYASTTLNIYGTNNSTVAFALSLSGSNDGFIAKYDSSGVPQWARRFGGTGDDRTVSIITDNYNNLYVFAQYASAPLNIYGTNNTTIDISLSNVGSSDMCIIKYDPSGAPLLVRRIGGTGAETATSIFVSRNSDIYVGGVSASAILNVYSGNNPVPIINNVTNDAFIMKYNANVDTNNQFINTYFQLWLNSLFPNGLPSSLSNYFNRSRTYIANNAFRETSKQNVKLNRNKFTSLVDDLSGSIVTNFIEQKSAGYNETLVPKLTIVANGQTVDLSSNISDLSNNIKELYLYGVSGDQVTLKINEQNYLLTILDNGAIYAGAFYGLDQFIKFGNYGFTIKFTGSVGGILEIDSYDEGYLIGISGLANANPYTIGSIKYTRYNEGYIAGQADRVTAYNIGYSDGISDLSQNFTYSAFVPLQARYNSGYVQGQTDRATAYNAGYSDGVSDLSQNLSYSVVAPLQTRYNSAYVQGQTDRATAYNAGYSDGISDLSQNLSYSVVAPLQTRYNSAYVQGQADQVSAYNAGYSDGISDLSQNFTYSAFVPLQTRYNSAYVQGQTDRVTAYNAGYSDGISDLSQNLSYSAFVPLQTRYNSAYVQGQADRTTAYNTGYSDPDNSVERRTNYSPIVPLQERYDFGYTIRINELRLTFELLPSKGTTTFENYLISISGGVETPIIGRLAKEYIRDNFFKLKSLVSNISGDILAPFMVDVMPGYDYLTKTYLVIVAIGQEIKFNGLMLIGKELYLWGPSGETVALIIDSCNHIFTMRDDGVSYKGINYGLGSTVRLRNYLFTLNCVGSAGGPFIFDETTNGGNYDRTKGKTAGTHVDYLETRAIFADRVAQPIESLETDTTKVKKNKGASFTSKLESLSYSASE